MTVPAKRDPRDLDLGPIRLTATGLQFLAAPTLDEWRQAFGLIKRCENAVQFWVGDMILTGENMFGEEAAQEYDKETWRRWCWVCEKVQPDVRRRTLSFTHHEKVARLEPREQRQWLERAEREGWSANELGRQIKGQEPPDDDEDEKERCPTCGKAGWSGVYAWIPPQEPEPAE